MNKNYPDNNISLEMIKQEEKETNERLRKQNEPQPNKKLDKQ